MSVVWENRRRACHYDNEVAVLNLARNSALVLLSEAFR